VSVDGWMQVRIRDPHPFTAAVVKAEDGHWTLPDYEVHVSATQKGSA
jgi:hypothetical protein